MEIDSRPVEIDELQRAVDRMKMEELALERETDEASQERLAQLRRDLADRSTERRADGAVGAGAGRPQPRRRAERQATSCRARSSVRSARVT